MIHANALSLSDGKDSSIYFQKWRLKKLIKVKITIKFNYLYVTINSNVHLLDLQVNQFKIMQQVF